MVKNIFSGKDPRKVFSNKTTGLTKCDARCARFAGYKLCAHIIAVAEKSCYIWKFLECYKKKEPSYNITAMTNVGLSNNRGKKAVKSTQRRKGRPKSCKAPEVMDYETSTANEESIARDSTTQPFHLTFLAGIIKKCYGCGQMFSNKNRTPPHDIILKRFDHRIYMSPNSKTKKKTQTLQNTYFHLSADCARKVVPSFEFRWDVLIHNEIKTQLSSAHMNVLSLLKVVGT